MSKKKQVDKSLVLSKDNFSKFTKITEDNIRDFYYNYSIFIVAIVSKVEYTILHSFGSRRKHKRGFNPYYFLCDDTILETKIRCNEESEEEYNELQDNFYPYLRDQIKLGNLYAIKINLK